MKKLIPILMLILSYGIINAQPYFALGMSRSAVIYNMKSAGFWKLTHESRSDLVYACDTSGILFTYRFVKDEPCGLNRTCTELVIDFPTSESMQAYLEHKMNTCKLNTSPDGLGYTLVTDLYDITIHVYSVGTRKLIIKY